MKKLNILLIGVLSLGFIAMSSCGDSSDKTSNNSEEAVVNKDVVADSGVKLKVEGMVCAMGCAAVIEEELGHLNGVAFAKVNFEEELASIEYDSKLISEEELIAAIEGVGDHLYTATKVEDAPNLDPEVEEVSDVLDVVETVVKH